MSAYKIHRMANQIALFMETKPAAEGRAEFAAHINDYWDPRMRQQFFTLIASEPEGFRPLVREAAALVRQPVVLS